MKTPTGFTPILAILFIFACVTAAGAPAKSSGFTIGETCGNYREIEQIRKLGELGRRIRETCDRYASIPGGETVVRSAMDALKAIEKLAPDAEIDPPPAPPKPADPAAVSRAKLKAALGDMAASITLLLRKPAPPSLPNPLTQPLRDLLALTKTAQERKARDAEGYYRDYLNSLLAVLRKTENGATVLQCWERRNPLPIVGSEIIPMPRDPSGNPGPTAMFVPRDASLSLGAVKPLQTEKYTDAPAASPSPSASPDASGERQRFLIKRILFNPDSDPIEALHVLTHEMRHSCNADADAVLSNEYALREDRVTKLRMACCPGTGENAACDEQCFANVEKSPEKMKMDEARREKDQASLAGECGGYSTQVAFYKELAQAEPGLVCNYQYVSGFYNNQVISSGEYQAASEKMLREGTLPLIVGRDYSTPPMPLKSRNLFVDHEAGPARKILRPELIKKLRAAGCNL